MNAERREQVRKGSYERPYRPDWVGGRWRRGNRRCEPIVQGMLTPFPAGGHTSRAPARSVAPPAARRLTYLPALDGLRGLAVLLVSLLHFHVPFLPGGYLGVDVFFVLSGFLITGLLVQEWQTHGSIDLWRFYARRMLRLMPALWVMLLLLLVPLLTAEQLLAGLGYAANWVMAGGTQLKLP